MRFLTITIYCRCKEGQCLPLCDVSVLKQRGFQVTEHLESDPNIPKPSCDDSYVNEVNIPTSNSRLYVPSGDIVRIDCGSKNNEKRLVHNTTHHVKGTNCYGDFLDLVCFKIGNHVSEWRILSDPRNNKIPKCVDGCKENRYAISYS